MICPRGVCLIESGCAIKVETHNEGGDAERPASIALRVALAGKRNMLMSSRHKRPRGTHPKSRAHTQRAHTRFQQLGLRRRDGDIQVICSLNAEDGGPGLLVGPPSFVRFCSERRARPACDQTESQGTTEAARTTLTTHVLLASHLTLK